MKTLMIYKKQRREASNTRRFVITSLFIIGATVAAFAQPNDKQAMREKMKAAKVGMITGRLELTADQAQKFWPVYNEYESKQEKQRDKMKEMKDREMSSDADYTKMINDMLDMRQKEVDLEKEYKSKFLKVISARQLVELYKAEHEFRRMLLHRLEGRRAPEHGGRGMGSNGPGRRGPMPDRAAPTPPANGIPAPDRDF